MFNRIRKLLFVVTTTVIFISCSKNERENVIVVSVEPQRALLEEIVDDKFKVVSVLSAGANPETFEPGMQMRRNLDNAQAYMITGYLPFEKKLAESIDDDVIIVDTSEGIEPVYGTHVHLHNHSHDCHHHHEHGEADPHTWTSVKNAKRIVANMYESVVKIDPLNQDYYTARYIRLTERLDSLDNAMTARLDTAVASHTFAIWHPSLSYFARDYGLEQLSVGFENKEMAASALHDMIIKAKENGVKVFFFQKEFDSRQAETLNNEMGTTLVTINPLDYDWEQQIERIVSALCQ